MRFRSDIQIFTSGFALMVAKSPSTNCEEPGTRLPENAFQDIARTWSMKSVSNPEDMVRQAFQAALASFSGYSRIVNYVVNDDVRTFCEQVASQRHAHCKALASLVESPQTLMSGWDEGSLAIRGRWNLVCNGVRRQGVCRNDEILIHLDAIESQYEDMLVKAVEACPADVSGALLEARYSVQQARALWKHFCVAAS